MSKTKAYLIATVFCALFPIRWWEGKSIFAIILMVLWAWFICAGVVLDPFYYTGNVVLFLFEISTLSNRVDTENSRLEREF